MRSHPDADAFVRAFLRDPKDETTRLVFADWLEDTGQPHNAAWAGYIRAKSAASRAALGSAEWQAWEDEAAEFAADVVANLSLSVRFFLGYPASLLRLIPGPNITVRLGAAELPRSVIEFVPESVARENLILPLQMQGLVLLVVAAHPNSRDLHDKLEFILNRTVVAVRAEPDDIQNTINATYGQTETESVDSVFIEFSDVARPLPRYPVDPTDRSEWDDGPIGRLLGLLVGEAISSGVQQVRVAPHGMGGEVSYRAGGVWSPRFPIPLRVLPGLARHVARLAGIDDELARQRRARGEFRFDYVGMIYTVGVSVAEAPSGPRVDFDISDRFELRTGPASRL